MLRGINRQDIFEDDEDYITKEPSLCYTLAETGVLKSNGDRVVSLYMFPKGTEEKAILNTVANIQNLLGAHEFLGHYKNGWSNHSKVVPFQRKHSTWNKTTKEFKDYNYKVYGK